MKKQSSQLTFATLLPGTPALPFTTSSQDEGSKACGGAGRNPVRRGLPAQRRDSMVFPQGGVFHARFALLAGHPSRTLGT